MAAVESMSVISVLLCVTAVNVFVLSDGLSEELWRGPRIAFDQPAFGPLQPRELGGIFEQTPRSASQLLYHLSVSYHRIIAIIDIMEIARSTCSNGLA